VTSTVKRPIVTVFTPTFHGPRTPGSVGIGRREVPQPGTEPVPGAPLLDPLDEPEVPEELDPPPEDVSSPALSLPVASSPDPPPFDEPLEFSPAEDPEDWPLPLWEKGSLAPPEFAHAPSIVTVTALAIRRYFIGGSRWRALLGQPLRTVPAHADAGARPGPELEGANR
jgi:hypothetical protein